MGSGSPCALFIAPAGAELSVDWSRWLDGDASDPEQAVPGGVCVGRNRGRDVWRVSDPAVGITFYVKRFWQSAGMSRALGEARRLDAFAAADVRAPAVLATAARSDGYSAVAVQALDGVELDRALRLSTTAQRRRLVEVLGRALGRMHRAGLAHGQLFCWHVLVDGDEVGFLDVADAKVQRDDIAWRWRVRDFAALLSTLELSACSSPDRRRLLAAAGLDRVMLRRVWSWIRLRQTELHRRGRLPRNWSVEERNVDGDRLFLPAGVSAETTFDDWWRPAKGVLVRERDGRENWRWSDPPGEGGSTWFGKSYGRFWGKRRPPAFREIDAHRLLAGLGFAVSTVVAAARSKDGRSVLWTRGLVPGTTLRDRLHAGGLTPSARRDLARQLGRTVARLHRCGLVHRDLYLDHFLEERTPDGASRWVLIDLARVRESAQVSGRARCKDLSALEYSARTALVSATDRLRALRTYLGGHSAEWKAWALRIHRRAQRIEDRERRHGRFPVAKPLLDEQNQGETTG